MKISKEISEPVLIKVESISDDRGLLIPFTDNIDNELFKRSYLVENYGRGVIRGLHYHKEEIKIFTIAAGAAKFITFKLPEILADRNKKEEIEQYSIEHPESIKSWVISNRHHAVLVIPAKYANGWISLEDHTVLVSLSSLEYELAKGDDIRIDPLIIGKQYWRVIER